MSKPFNKCSQLSNWVGDYKLELRFPKLERYFYFQASEPFNGATKNVCFTTTVWKLEGIGIYAIFYLLMCNYIGSVKIE
jgi:hypothetical protein